ncbi:hypothetical protein WR25_20598 [Diploscapter pachys]|uniref:Phospholipase B-like n=1 Tax=Diploscapter pachys TaxID=2018661 RepID=A0A2A2K5L8_9BILA|nr:hypothetical protein WR25_20598 [Diploscapter pachys]
MFIQFILILCSVLLTNSHRHEREDSVCENEFGGLHVQKNVPGEYGIGDKYNKPCHKHLGNVHYLNAMNQTGWTYLEMEIVDKSLDHLKQGYVAGYLEGKATRDLIALHIRNMLSDYCEGKMQYCQKLRRFIRENVRWMAIKIAEHKHDAYWKQVALTLSQLKGIQDAYYHRKPSLNDNFDIDIDGNNDGEYIEPLMLLQISGDLLDLNVKFKRPKDPKTPFAKKGSHCSAIVKLLPDNSDLLFSHVTWMSYSIMLRTLKKYKFLTGDAGQEYSFSVIASFDDFLVTSSKLGVLETTIENHNEELWAYITSNSLLYWVRSQVATRMASTGKEWIKAFIRHNSGTYNNEWVIVDYKKFKRGQKQQDAGLLYVLELMPAMVEHQDMTSHLLNTTYWPGYNRAYFPLIQKASDVPKMVRKYGDWFSYDKAPRAKIFARDHHTVVDMDSLLKLMRSNNFKHDPFSRCNCTPPYSGESAISCRSDLNDRNGYYPIEDLGFFDQGAIDVKVTNSHLIESLQFTAIAGPTHDPLPVFDWKNDPFNGTVLHFGQPSRWAYDIYFNHSIILHSF